MLPRVLFRTHYQVDEPALMELLVKLCTSPVKSSYSETVAQKLAREVRARGKSFNVPAAGYALDLARGLGLVNENNAWTDKGHLLALTAELGDGPWEAELALTPREQLAHFRLFLEADGAALLYLARHVLEHRRIPNTDDDWNDLARQLFTQIYSECLRLAGTTADRVALRSEIDRMRAHGYTGKSGPHKMFVHLQVLYRLCLIERSPTSSVRQYILPQGKAADRLKTLTAEVPDLYALESVIKQNRVLDIATKIYYGTEALKQYARTSDDVLRLVAPVYRAVMATGIPLCPLTTAIETMQISLLADRCPPLPYTTALEFLQRSQKDHLGAVRFHVDRRGQPAFLKLSDELLAAYSHGAA